jgi:hypothetical protein
MVFFVSLFTWFLPKFIFKQSFDSAALKNCEMTPRRSTVLESMASSRGSNRGFLQSKRLPLKELSKNIYRRNSKISPDWICLKVI